MRKIHKVAAAAAVALGLVLLDVIPAQAATGNDYVVVNNRVCSAYGGEVRGILANDPQSGFTTTAWDNGDNIVYPRTVLNVRNQINIQARCEKKVAVFFWQTTGYTTVVGFFTPTATGQTFWVG